MGKRHPGFAFGRLGLILASLPASLPALAQEKVMPQAPRTLILVGEATSPSEVRVEPGDRYDGRHGFEPAAANLFSIQAAPGNYRVTLKLAAARPGVVTVKAESRRLMLHAAKVAGRQPISVSFIVNVRDARLAPRPAGAPGLDHVLVKPREAAGFTWDDRLTLEFLGDPAAVQSVTIDPVAVPTVFLLGDSTVADQPAEPDASWGQMLPSFFAPDIAIANHAESGETLKSFLMAGRLAKVLELARPGDWALIQFGHNDQKANWPQTHAPADGTYRSYLRLLIEELRARGVRPILVTSPERRNWTAAQRIKPTLADYAAAVRAVSASETVPLIDLNADSIRLYEALGETRAPLAFSAEGKDRTHHNNYGAWLLARAVVSQLTAAEPTLSRHVRTGLPAFDPASPPTPDALALPPSGIRSTQRPDGS